MLPEGYTARQGDVLILHATVTHDFVERDDSYVHLKINGHYQSLLLAPEHVEGLAYLGIEPGEKVYHPEDRIAGTVIAVEGGYAWIKSETGHHFVYPLKMLERVEPPKLEIVEPPPPEQAEAA